MIKEYEWLSPTRGEILRLRPCKKLDPLKGHNCELAQRGKTFGGSVQ